MDWFSNPLTEIFGIPVFWVARIAKIIQFLSGLVIIIEIIGKERVETYAGVVKGALSKIVAAGPFRKLLKEYFRIFRSRFQGYDDDETSTMKYFSIPLLIMMILTGVICSSIFIAKFIQLGGCPVPFVIIPVFFVSMMFGYLLFVILLLLLVLVIFVVFRPIEWSFDVLVGYVVSVLEHRGLSQVLFIVSFLFLVISSILELLAS